MLTYKQEDEPSASEDAQDSANETPPPLPLDDAVVSTTEVPSPPMPPPPSSLESDDLLVTSASLIELFVVYLEFDGYCFGISLFVPIVTSIFVVSGAKCTNWLCISN